MAGNFEMYDRAKNESEKLFKYALKSTHGGVAVPGYGNVRFESVMHVDSSMSVLDCEYHIDVMSEAFYEDNSHQTWKFDVKDVTDKWMHKKNYSVPSHQIDFYKSSLDEHWIAFRLNDGVSKRLDKFCVVHAQDICKLCAQDNFRSEYYLLPLDSIKSCSRQFEVEADF